MSRLAGDAECAAAIGGAAPEITCVGERNVQGLCKATLPTAQQSPA